MQTNPNQGIAIAILVLVSLLADVVAVACGAGKDFPDPTVLVGYALLFGQVSLGAIWLGLGSGTIALRLAAHIVILAIIYYCLSSLHDNDGEWMHVLAVQTFAIAGPLAVGGWYGLRLQVTSSMPDEQSWQFTLKHVFALTTACALLLGLFRLSPPWRELGNRSVQALIIGGGFALLALVAAWVALGYGRWLYKLLALPAVTCLVGCLLIAIEVGDRPEYDRGVMAIVFGQMLFLAGSLAVLRRRGYRLVRYGRRSGFTA